MTGGVLAGVATGTPLGTIDAAVIGVLRVNAVVATLATFSACRGVAFPVAPGGRPVGVLYPTLGLLGSGRVFQSEGFVGIPIAPIILAAHPRAGFDEVVPADGRSVSTHAFDRHLHHEYFEVDYSESPFDPDRAEASVPRVLRPAAVRAPEQATWEQPDVPGQRDLVAFRSEHAAEVLQLTAHVAPVEGPALERRRRPCRPRVHRPTPVRS